MPSEQVELVPKLEQLNRQCREKESLVLSFRFLDPPTPHTPQEPVAIRNQLIPFDKSRCSPKTPSQKTTWGNSLVHLLRILPSSANQASDNLHITCSQKESKIK